MTAAELISQARRLYLADTRQPYLWCDEELLAHLNWAYKRAAYWSLALRDDTTAETCQITLAAGQAEYALSPKIIVVNSLWLNLPEGLRSTLPAIGADTAENRYGPDWQTAEGLPAVYVPNGHSIRLVRVPSAEFAGLTLGLDVFRLPLADLALTDTPAGFDAIKQESLLYGLCGQALLKIDVDSGNVKKAGEFMAMFTAEFGPPVSHTTRLHNLNQTGSLRASFNGKPRDLMPRHRAGSW